MEWPDSLPLAAWLILHIGGLVAACLSRLTLGARTDVALQMLASIGFFMIATLAVLSLAAGGDQFRLWVLSGTTLGAMVIAAVFEPRANSTDPLLARFATLDE